MKLCKNMLQGMIVVVLCCTVIAPIQSMQNDESMARKRGDATEMLLNAIKSREIVVCQQVLNDADVNGTDAWRWSCLMLACSVGDVAIVELLLKHGVDVDQGLISTDQSPDQCADLPLGICLCQRDNACELTRLLLLKNPQTAKSVFEWSVGAGRMRFHGERAFNINGDARNLLGGFLARLEEKKHLVGQKMLAILEKNKVVDLSFFE
jgi:hypothetical protein